MVRRNMKDTDDHFLSHPELKPYFNDIVPSLISESDRGAVLLGVSYIDEQLNVLFKNLVPSTVSNKRKKEIFNYTGPFGGIASKLDVALVCRILSPGIIDAIHGLRKIRNDLAHNTSTFELKEYQEQFYRVFSLLGPGVDLGINRIALEAIMSNILSKLMDMPHPIDEGKPVFEGREEAIEYLSNNGEVLKVLDEQRPRWEFAIGVGVICGMILLYRDKILSAVDGNKTLLSAIK